MKLKWKDHETNAENQNLFLEDGTCVAHLYKLRTGQWTVHGYTNLIGTFVSPIAIKTPEEAQKWAVETICKHFQKTIEFMNNFLAQSI